MISGVHNLIDKSISLRGKVCCIYKVCLSNFIISSNLISIKSVLMEFLIFLYKFITLLIQYIYIYMLLAVRNSISLFFLLILQKYSTTIKIQFFFYFLIHYKISTTWISTWILHGSFTFVIIDNPEGKFARFISCI